MKVIFVFFSRLKWKYVKIMEVQEVNMEMWKKSLFFPPFAHLAPLPWGHNQLKFRPTAIPFLIFYVYNTLYSFI